MRLCPNREQSPHQSSTLLSKAQNYPYYQSLSGSIMSPQFLLQSNQPLQSQSIKYSNHLKQTLKTPVSDSILIQDKENCYISNKNVGVPATIPTSRTENGKKCQNHQKEKAEYYLVSEGGELFLYCNKCAAALISQGFKVDRISQKSIPTHSHSISQSLPQYNSPVLDRRHQLSQIWQFFQKIYSQALNKKNLTDNFTFTSQSFFNQQIQEINQYFNQLHTYLEVLKNRLYNSILHEKEIVIKQSEEWSGILSQVLTEIESIESDIRINQEGVIELGGEEYQQFIGVLSGHLRQYYNITESWKKDNLTLTGNKFQGAPVQQVQQMIRGMMMGGGRTPRTSLIKQRAENGGKTMGKSSSCMFNENRAMFERKYSMIGGKMGGE